MKFLNIIEMIFAIIIGFPFALAGGVIVGAIALLYYVVDIPLIFIQDIINIFKFKE